MPYEKNAIPAENAPALPVQASEYTFTVDLHGTLPDGTPRSTIDDLDIFSPDGGATNTVLLNYLDRVVVKVALRGEVLVSRINVKETYEEEGETKTRERVEERVEGVRGKNIPYAVLRRLMQDVDAAMKKAGSAGN